MKYRILVPLDFSDSGKYSLQAAQKVAALFDGSVTPFHANIPITDIYNSDIMGMEMMPSPVVDIEQIEEAHQEHLQEFSEKEIDKKYLNKPVVMLGNPVQTIIEAAKDFDMIVMSSHGRSGFSRFFLGSVSDKVLRSTHVPVLIVNKEKQLEKLQKIMLTTDFSEHSKKAFTTAIQLAQKANANVDLVHILSFDHKDEPDEAAITKRRQQLDLLAEETLHNIDQLVETKLIVSSDTPYEAILNENLNTPYDLIVMSAVGHTGIEYMMMGSTTSSVVRHVKSPVLSINPKHNPDLREEE